jgi:hypothetical protein
MTAINRRLIEKRINFIVPGKQLFLPDLLLDLRENGAAMENGEKRGKLLPSAQFILLFHLQHQQAERGITALTFKELAEELGYTAMVITNAAENLRSHQLCSVTGRKEKYIAFNYGRAELWKAAQPYLASPVLKQVFVDEKPDMPLLRSNASALPGYADLDPGRQQYYAIGKNDYYDLHHEGKLVNENEFQGAGCLEV